MVPVRVGFFNEVWCVKNYAGSSRGTVSQYKMRSEPVGGSFFSVHWGGHTAHESPPGASALHTSQDCTEQTMDIISEFLIFIDSISLALALVATVFACVCARPVIYLHQRRLRERTFMNGTNDSHFTDHRGQSEIDAATDGSGADEAPAWRAHWNITN